MATVTRPGFDSVYGVLEAEICNIALGHIGGELIKDTTEDTKQARVCKAVYAQTRDELLRTYPFNFATRIADIPIDDDPGTIGEFDYAYKAEDWMDATGTVVAATKILTFVSGGPEMAAPETLIGREVKMDGIPAGARITDQTSTGPVLGVYTVTTITLDRGPTADISATTAFTIHIPVLKTLGIEANDTNDFAAIGGGSSRRILCNVGEGATLEMKYVHQVINPEEFDSMFSHALSLRIASKIAMDITKNMNVVQLMQQEFSAIFQQAKISSSEEKQIDSADTWWTDQRTVGSTPVARR